MHNQYTPYEQCSVLTRQTNPVTETENMNITQNLLKFLQQIMYLNLN